MFSDEWVIHHMFHEDSFTQMLQVFHLEANAGELLSNDLQVAGPHITTSVHITNLCLLNNLGESHT